MMDKEQVASWLNEMTDKQFIEFFYERLSSRHTYKMEKGYLDSHLVLMNATRDLEDNGAWSHWHLELLCPAKQNYVDDAPVGEFGTHCGLQTASWAKHSICPVCGGEVYGT